jgi:hypothetical protein
MRDAQTPRAFNDALEFCKSFFTTVERSFFHCGKEFCESLLFLHGRVVQIFLK